MPRRYNKFLNRLQQQKEAEKPTDRVESEQPQLEAPTELQTLEEGHHSSV